MVFSQAGGLLFSCRLVVYKIDVTIGCEAFRVG